MQGMGFLAAVLLLYMSAEEAFWTLVALLQVRGLSAFASRLPYLLSQSPDAHPPLCRFRPCHDSDRKHFAGMHACMHATCA